MYQPKIRDDLIVTLREIQQMTSKPMTVLVDEMLRPQVVRRYRQLKPEREYAVQLNLFDPAVRYPNERINISSPHDVWVLCKDMVSLTQERVDVLLLNTKHDVQRREVVFLGTLNTSVIHPREIFAPAIQYRAAFVILVHNHPSRNVEPSSEDIRATKMVKQTGDIIGIELLDHIIIGNGFTSLKEDGYLS